MATSYPMDKRLLLKQRVSLKIMKLELVVVGKTTEKWLKTGFDQYWERMGHYMPCSIREVASGGSLPQSKALEKEGAAILEKIQPRDHVVLLDERGREFTSVELAEFLGRQMAQVSGTLVFVTGGAYGFSDDVRKRANTVLSASRFTFTHQMIRLIIAEQLYRAMTILRNEPYHHS